MSQREATLLARAAGALLPGGSDTRLSARRAPLYRHLMFSSWRDWSLPHVRWVYVGVYVVAALLALVLGAGGWSVLIGVAVGVAVVGPLELWYRQRPSRASGRPLAA